jgi:hypothetical protein
MLGAQYAEGRRRKGTPVPGPGYNTETWFSGCGAGRKADDLALLRNPDGLINDGADEPGRIF